MDALDKSGSWIRDYGNLGDCSSDEFIKFKSLIEEKGDDKVKEVWE